MTPVATPVITYNLADRGRKYRGKERNFHLQRMAESINSPKTQERVRHRDMLGYYGHWPRIRFGMYPSEGDQTKAVEPALVTTLLTACADGTIQHQAEFLQTRPGQIAAQLFNSRTGGFSSAIDENMPEFFGFDYVLEPNYSTNRGYEISFDSATGNFSVDGMSLDAIMTSEYNDQLSAAFMLLEQSRSAQNITLDALKRLQAENEDLLSRLASTSVMDGAAELLSVSKRPAEQLLRDIREFKTARLPKLADREEGDSFADTRLYQRLKNGY